MKTLTLWIEIPVLVDISDYTKGDPGCFSGPIEGQYPATQEDVEYSYELPSEDLIEAAVLGQYHVILEHARPDDGQ